MSKRNLGSIFLGDRGVQHLPHHLAHIPMSPPLNPGDTSATLVPPGTETTEPSLDGHTDEVASLIPEESESAAEGGDEDEAEAELKAEADADVDAEAVAQEQKKVGKFAQPDSGDTLQTIHDLPTATLADTLLAPNPISVSPELMLELRLRWIEALVLGIGKDGNVVPPREQDMTGTVSKKLNEAQRALDDAVKANEGLRRFMGVCAWYTALPFHARDCDILF